MSRVNRWMSVTLAALWLAAIAPSASVAQSVIRGPYLQMGTPTSVVVRWRTDIATDSRVSYGSAPGGLTSFVDDPVLKKEHEITLSPLLADTVYYYAIGTTTRMLAGDDASHFVLTAPTPATPKPTRIWVLGDSGTADESAAAVRDAYLTFAGTRHTDLWLMLGDNAYSDGTDSEYQAAVFDMYPSMLRKSVLWPTLGNHDGHSADSDTESGPYYDIFTLPRDGEAGGVASGTEAYYSFDYGNIHFVVLDSFESDRSPGGAMLTWLAADLAATTQDWIIAFWHHPPYSKGSHDSDTSSSLGEMRRNALPVLEQGGVDLVLAGHSHSYERSFLLDGHYGTSDTLVPSMILDGGDGRCVGEQPPCSPTGNGAYQKPIQGPAPHLGAVYTVAGSSGQTSGGSLDHPVMFVSLDVLGSLVLDVAGGRLDATFLDATGGIRDTFTILKGRSPVAVADSAMTDEDTPVVINVLGNDEDPDGDVLLVASVTTPGHGTVVINADQTVTYAPAPNFNGTDSFTYTAGDARGGSGTATVTVTVNPVNDPPVAANQSVTTTSGTPVAITLEATDADGDALVYSVLDEPVHGALTGTAPNLTYTPSAGFAGSDSFTFTASDASGGASTATVTVTVNDPPVAVADSAMTDEDTPVVINVLGNDADPDGDVLGVASVTAPAHGTVVINADQTVTYTPAPNSNGTDSFTYTAGDARGGRATATVTVTVNAVDDPPVAVADSAMTDEDTPVVINVLGNDEKPDGDVLGVVSVTTPGHGTVVINADQTVTYAPAPNFNGTDSFTYTAGDARGGSGTATVTVTVNPVNDAPVAASQSVTTTSGTPVAITLEATDADGDALAYGLVEQSVHGALTGTAPNLTYTPNAGFAGSDSFTFTAGDGRSTSSVATVSITVSVETVAVATDGFESGNFSGGTGWGGPWTTAGNVSIRTDTDSPEEGTSHVRLRRKSGYLQREVNLLGAQNVHLTFWAKVKSFDSSDRALVKVSPDGVTFTTVKVFTSADSDDTYHFFDIDLSGLSMTSLHVAFDAEMSSNSDYWFLDDIVVTGVRR